MIIFNDLWVIDGEIKVLMELGWSLECIHTWETGDIWANLFDFSVNIDIELLYAFNEIIEGRFHLFFNRID